MKIANPLPNTKAGKAAKLANLHAAHNRTVRYEGNTYRIIVATVGPLTLASAENMQGHAPLVNLFGTDTAAKDLRRLVENRIYS